MQYRMEKGSDSVHALNYYYDQVVNYYKRVSNNMSIINFFKGNIQNYVLFKVKPTLYILKYLNAIKIFDKYTIFSFSTSLESNIILYLESEKEKALRKIRDIIKSG